MTKITSALAAALVASASFASVALAEGDYYEGVQKPAAVQHSQSGSYGYTGSISRAQGAQADAAQVVDSGDYYAGANRPN